jgi:hypothetical protein
MYYFMLIMINSNLCYIVIYVSLIVNRCFYFLRVPENKKLVKNEYDNGIFR